MSEHPGRPGRGSLDAPDDLWSFGGATTIETAEGVLLPEALLIGPSRAVMHACWCGGSVAADLVFHQVPEFDDVIAVDDRGARCVLRVEAVSSGSEPSETGWPTSLRLGLDPVPGRGARWLELRGKDGTSTRLLPSARATVQVGQLAPAAVSAAEQELSDLALSLIALQPGDAGTSADAVRRRCAAVLARTTEPSSQASLTPRASSRAS